MIVTTSQTRTLIGMERHAKLLLDLGGEAVPVGVVQADVERLQPAKHGRPDASRRDSADLHPLEVVRT